MPQFAKGFRGLFKKILYFPSFWLFKYTLLILTRYMSPPFCSTWCIFASALGRHRRWYTIHTHCQSFWGMLFISLETELGPLYFQRDFFPSIAKLLAIEIQNSSKLPSIRYSVQSKFRSRTCVFDLCRKYSSHSWVSYFVSSTNTSTSTHTWTHREGRKNELHMLHSCQNSTTLRVQIFCSHSWKEIFNNKYLTINGLVAAVVFRA